ncbi:MAG: hypothetical protein KDC48_19185, partial [Planctomycetes bacterium]|nr:hypothetical protein [Planctomycetota bacterium]
MKRLALVSLFAATLAAQQAPPAPPKAVAAAIAVEEQEGDLDKAERLYRDLLADEKLPATARSTVNLRLGRLLQKLGKSEAAKPFLQAAKGDVVSLDDITGFDDFGPQDAAREKALRAEAQALLKEPGDLIASDISWDQLAGPLPERLLWIGRPAVPAIIATLENTSLSPEPATGLFALLWRIGGVQAQAFLAQSLKDPTRCITAAMAAAAAPDGDMLDFAGKQLFVVDWPTARTMLSHNTYASPRDLQGRLGSNLLLDLADRGNAEVQAYVLDLFRTSGVDDLAAANRYVALVRRGLASTEPVLGTAAERCLSADFTQGSMAGLELLFDMLPSHAELRPRWVGLPADVVDQRHGMAADAAAHRLWPKAVHSALSLATDHPGRSWLSQMLRWIGGSLDAAAAPEVFHLLDAGY